MAFARGFIAQQCDYDLATDQQWALDMIALSWSMRRESRGIQEALAEATKTFRPPRKEVKSGTRPACRFELVHLPRTVHIMVLGQYVRNIPDKAALLEAVKTLIPRAFDGFPEWSVKVSAAFVFNRDQAF